MLLAISHPALIAHMLSFKRLIASGRYSAEINSGATMSFYFFVDINFHGDSFLPTELLEHMPAETYYAACGAPHQSTDWTILASGIS